MLQPIKETMMGKEDGSGDGGDDGVGVAVAAWWHGVFLPGFPPRLRMLLRCLGGRASLWW